LDASALPAEFFAPTAPAPQVFENHQARDAALQTGRGRHLPARFRIVPDGFELRNLDSGAAIWRDLRQCFADRFENFGLRGQLQQNRQRARVIGRGGGGERVMRSLERVVSVVCETSVRLTRAPARFLRPSSEISEAIRTPECEIVATGGTGEFGEQIIAQTRRFDGANRRRCFA
jgi:hypothetical protein